MWTETQKWESSFGDVVCGEWKDDKMKSGKILRDTERYPEKKEYLKSLLKKDEVEDE